LKIVIEFIVNKIYKILDFALPDFMIVCSAMWMVQLQGHRCEFANLLVRLKRTLEAVLRKLKKSLMQQQIVVTHRYTLLPETAKT